MSREAMLEVLERAADDITFYSQLAEDPQVALCQLAIKGNVICRSLKRRPKVHRVTPR